MIWFWFTLTVIALLLLGYVLHLSFSRVDPQDRRYLDPVPVLLRPVWPLVEVVAYFSAPYLGRRFVQRLARLIDKAGWRFWLSPHQLLALTLVSAFLAWLAPLLISFVLGRSYPLAAACAMALLLALLPLLLALRQGQARARQIRRQLPFYMDLLVLALEGGHPISAALTMAARMGVPGVLHDELNRVLRDLRAGSNRLQALQALEQRLDLVEISSLVATLSLGERNGLRLGPLLRAQADARRQERYVLAEKKALQAPVKMLFPLLFFVFPGTFAILLFPIYAQWISNGRFL